MSIDILFILMSFLNLKFDFACLHDDVVVVNETWLDPYLCSSKSCLSPYKKVHQLAEDFAKAFCDPSIYLSWQFWS